MQAGWQPRVAAVYFANTGMDTILVLDKNTHDVGTLRATTRYSRLPLQSSIVITHCVFDWLRHTFAHTARTLGVAYPRSIHPWHGTASYAEGAGHCDGGVRGR